MDRPLHGQVVSPDVPGTIGREGLHRAVRAAWGAAVVATAKLVGLWAYQVPVLGLLGATSLAFVLAAGLFGWAGLAAAAAVHVSWAVVRGSPLPYIAVSTVAYFAAGCLVYLTFLRVPRIGRTFPDLRSFAWYAAASGFGGLVSAWLISVFFEPGRVLAETSLWGRSTVVTVWVFGPALLLAGMRLLPRWVARVPDEAVAPPVPGYQVLSSDDTVSVELIRRPEARTRRSLLVAGVAILAVAALSLVAVRGGSGLGYWTHILYLIPIYWVTHRHRLPGGLAAVAGAGLAMIAVDALRHLGRPGPLDSALQIEIYGHLLVFLAVGVLLGQARERETVLIEALRSTNRRLRGDLQRVVRALSGAVEAKDHYTEGHLRRVAHYALEVGRRLGLSERELDHLRIASALHDVGKIGVPEQILNKPGPLTPHERAVVERHPEIGARILDAVDGLGEASPLVLHHQERWDGRRDGPYPGYPSGLAGEQIPIGARIIAVVDAFDAMTTDRAYRAAVSLEEAVSRLRAERGLQFDPKVVDAFLELIQERPWS